MSPPSSARRSTTPSALAFATMFGLAARHAAVLDQLAQGQPIRGLLRVDICALRRALDTEAIDTTPRGYMLTDAGRAECRIAVDEFTAWVTGRAA